MRTTRNTTPIRLLLCATLVIAAPASTQELSEATPPQGGDLSSHATMESWLGWVSPPCTPETFCKVCITTCIETCLASAQTTATSTCRIHDDECLCLCECRRGDAALY